MHYHKHLVIALTAFISLSLFACGAKDDAAAIRKMIDQAETLAEDHQIGDLMDLTAKGFSASPGGHDDRSVRGILFVAFKHYGTFDIRYPRPTVRVEKEAATAEATIHFMIVSKDKPMPDLKKLYENPQEWLDKAGEKADLYRLKLDLIKQDGNWRVQKADLSTLKGMTFSSSAHHIR